jgi:RimJ/RimL family protein N-acetyltransferase
MKPIAPVTLEANNIRLVPMILDHVPALERAAADGELWNLWYTSVPAPGRTAAYVETALAGLEAGHMLPWVVCAADSGEVLGSTRYHDIIAPASRVEIGYTWYAASHQRSHVNTTCKMLLFRHAFEDLGCRVVGLRTDNFNFRSQRAIEALGAKKDGVIRHHAPRPDGTVRDTVMYSVRDHEWPDVARHLRFRLERHTG